mgnify:CR=1 FL=1
MHLSSDECHLMFVCLKSVCCLILSLRVVLLYSGVCLEILRD